ncbi:MAG: alpha-amylase family glycosyl hydrolase [Flavobacteriaceae bacterium]
MPKNLFIIALVFVGTFAIGQVQNATLSTSPETFNEDESVTLTFSGLNPSQWGVTDVYLWAWYFKNGIQSGGPDVGNGDWNNSNEALKLTNNGNGTYSFTLTPTTFFNDTGITKMGVLVKAKNAESQGSGERKTPDFLIDVGKVLMNITSHSGNTILVQGNQITKVFAVMTAKGNQEAGSFSSYFNNQLIDSGNGYPTYNLDLNVSENGTLKIVGSPFSSSETAEIEIAVEVAPTITEEAIPAGLQEGINYHTDTSKATLVLNAPNKDYVYVAGSFNNYSTSSTYLMKKDPNSDLFWLELTGLTPGEIYHYQYWVYDTSPVANSPAIVKTADPYSTLVLSPFDDEYIPATSYPNLPAYPTGQEREVTVLQTAQTAYNWQVPNFQKPTKEDLVIYEVLIRDFDANRSFQDLIDRVSYFKNLNINAIQLMPIMEFEGNESWGYNTAFHMALDKFYGTPEKFKELVDTFHQNGIAVILDLAINHAFGRAPGVRMWMDDPDGNGWGEPSSENPYFNEEPKHSYNVGSDFNHQSTMTKNFTKRVIKHWIEEYKIDGFRWDLTKGFTQNCTANDEGCTGSYQADRVAVLKEYADYSWSLDANHYVIFEHLGGDTEEKVWADYKLSEGKGIMLWGKMTEPYNQLSMGYSSNPTPDIEKIRSESRGFNGKRLVGYSESHDEERLMYKNLQFGNSTQSGHNVKNLNVALSRMSAIGAVSLLVPGPKMIWHFGELGMEQSLNTCTDGIVNDCRLDTKPQPQWVWLANTQRKKIYDDWSRMNDLKQSNAVFKGESDINPSATNILVQRVYLWDNSLGASELKNVIILANFDVTTQGVVAGFNTTGTWYNLMDNSTLNVSSTNQTVTLAPGEFKIYGNQQATLSNRSSQLLQLALRQNPVKERIEIDLPTTDVYTYKLYSALGQELDSGEHNKGNVLRITAPTHQGVYFVVVKNKKNNQFGLCKVLVE